MKTVLITGAAGNIGNKLRQHFQGRYDLRLLDIDPRGDKEINQADLSVWSESWSDHFQGVDTVVHMAADPTANQIWDKVVGPNLVLKNRQILQIEQRKLQPCGRLKLACNGDTFLHSQPGTFEPRRRRQHSRRIVVDVHVCKVQ